MFEPYTTAQVKFDLQREIGAEGKNSMAYIAHDPQLDAEIVIKKVRKADLKDEAAFYREARLLYASAHPNVVQVRYACYDDDHVYVAMPLYRNGSLKRLIGERHLTVREIVSFGCQILSGLHHIHSMGLIHFDLKPDNILLSDRREAMISDFGLAAKMDGDGFAAPDQIYTSTRPPETLEFAEFDYRFDVHQFGSLLYSLCNGSDALQRQLNGFLGGPMGGFDAESWKAALLGGTYPDRDLFPPHVPARLRRTVKACLEVDPNARPKSALAVANELAQIDGNHLDWQHSVEGDLRVWKKDKDGTIFKLTVDGDRNSILTRTVGGGAAKRVSGGCVSGVSNHKIGMILGLK